jgi:hypothetical protein
MFQVRHWASPYLLGNLELSIIVGKHSMKKDDYLANLMMMPPKEPLPIYEFDGRTQHDAFAVSPEGLKGVRTLLLFVFIVLLSE